MAQKGKEVTGSIVRDVMTKSVITAQIDTEITEAIRVMKKYEIGSLSVVHDHHLIGIVTIQDVKALDNG